MTSGDGSPKCHGRGRSLNQEHHQTMYFTHITFYVSFNMFLTYRQSYIYIYISNVSLFGLRVQGVGLRVCFSFVSLADA